MADSSSQPPDFLILGAPKCGTTSVYHYLKQHPGIFLCPKETHYFICRDPGYDSVQTRTWDDYQSLFGGAQPGQLRGEVAVRYLYSAGAMKEIHQRVPDCRLIVMLREPVERTFSHFLMRFRTGGFSADGGAVIPTETDIRRYFEDLNHDIVSWSGYASFLKPWYERFSAEQVMVILLDDLHGDPTGTMKRLFEFLGVDSDVPVNTEERFNVSQAADFNPLIVRLKRVQLLRRLRNSRLLRSVARRIVPERLRDRMIWRPQKSGSHISEKIQLPDDVRAKLTEHFVQDREQLADLISRDLHEWPTLADGIGDDR